MMNKGVLAVVLLTIVLIGIVWLSGNSSIGGSVITGKAVTGNTILDSFKLKQGVAVAASGMTLKILNLPNKIEVGEEFVVKMSLTPGALLGSPVVGVVAEGLEIKDAPYGQFEENGDTIIWYFIPDYSNITFTVSASSAGKYNIEVRFAKFKPEGEGKTSAVLNVVGRGNYGNCRFIDNFDSLVLDNYGNNSLASLALSDSRLNITVKSGIGTIFRDKVYAREDGLTFQLKIKPGKGQTFIGFMNNDMGGVVAKPPAVAYYTHSLHFKGLVGNVYVLSAYEPGAVAAKRYGGSFVYNLDKEYDVKVVLRTNGADYYAKEAGSSSWTKIYSGTSSYSKNNLIAGVMSSIAKSSRHIDDWVVGTDGC